MEISGLALIGVAAFVCGGGGCTGGTRLGGAENIGDTMAEDTIVEVVTDSEPASDMGEDRDAAAPLPSCSESAPDCGGEAYCAYPEMRCRRPFADCADGWCVLPAAVFMMGDDGERGPVDGYQPTRHPVILSQGIRMKATEVTVAEWEALMGPLTHQRFPSCGSQCPATGGTTTAKFAFANAMSVRDGLEPCYGLEGCGGTGDEFLCESVTYKGLSCPGFRLPTEAESEFAARAGKDYCFDPTAAGVAGDRSAWDACTYIPDLADAEWYCANSDVTYDGAGACHDPTPGHQSRRCGYHAVGEKTPNAFGLHDTLGNVPEVTTTLWHNYPPTLETDPGHPPAIPNDAPLVHHGSNYGAYPIGCCPTARARLLPDQDIGGGIGFRLVQTIFEPQ